MKLPDRDERMLFQTRLQRDLIDYEQTQRVRIERVEIVRGKQGEIVDVKVTTEEK